MELILHDVEAIATEGIMHRSEVIEIAAIRVEVVDGALIRQDTFHTYIRPRGVTSIPVSTTKLTGITQEDVENADGFGDVIRAFQAWLGTEEYFLCSWSLSDRNFFIDDCRRFDVPVEWIRNYNDVQRWFCAKMGLSKRVKLVRALEMLELAPEGQFHNAMSDTVNTLRILERIYDPADERMRLLYNDCLGIPATELVYEDLVEPPVLADSPFAKLLTLGITDPK